MYFVELHGVTTANKTAQCFTAYSVSFIVYEVSLHVIEYFLSWDQFLPEKTIVIERRRGTVRENVENGQLQVYQKQTYAHIISQDTVVRVLKRWWSTGRILISQPNSTKPIILVPVLLKS